MKTIKKNGRVYKRMILTYIIILCIPILLSVVLYRYTHNEIQKQSQEESDDLLKMIGSTCDREISYFKNVLQQLKSNSNVKQLVNSKTLDEAHRQWLAFLVAEDMTTLRASMLDYAEYCDGLFLFLAEENVMVSAGSKTDFSSYCKFLKKMDEAESELFKEQMLQLERRLMVTFQRQQREYILLMEPMMSTTGKPLNAVVGLWIDPDVFEKQIRSAEWKQGREWAFIGSDGQYLHMTELLKSESPDLFTQKNGQVMIDGEKYQCLSLASSAYNGKYFLFSSIRQTSQVASRIRSLHLWCMVASLLLGYAVMKVSMKKNYMPLARLINTLPKRDGEMDRDEFQYLEKRMRGMVEQYSEVKESEAKNKRAMREAAFQKLLLPTRTKKQEMAADDKALFAKFRHGVNVVLIFCIRDEIQAEDGKGAVEMERSLKNFVVANVLAEGVGEKYTQETIEYEECVVMIVNLPEGESDAGESLQSLCNKYCAFVEDNFKFRINTFVGSGYKGIKGIHYSYLEACQAESFGTDSDENYICFREISDGTQYNYQYSFETEEMVINAMRDGNAQLASSLINKMLENNFDNPDRTLWQCMVYDIYTTLMKVSEERQGGVHKMPSISEAFTMASLQELQDWFGDLIQNICAKGREKSDADSGKENEKEELYREILVYIRENFKDPDLNVSQIALKFRMTPAYMSAIFKRYAGKSILDVIRQLRLEHARKLLEEGMSVYDVTPEVGFRDSTVFGRAFKNHYGITPGKVKKAVLENKKTD